jgi:hypothetical protein
VGVIACGIELQACRLEKASARLHQRMFAVDVAARHAAIHFFRIAAAAGVVRRGDVAIDQITVDEQLPHATERRFQCRRQGARGLRREAVRGSAGVELPKLQLTVAQPGEVQHLRRGRG